MGQWSSSTRRTSGTRESRPSAPDASRASISSAAGRSSRAGTTRRPGTTSVTSGDEQRPAVTGTSLVPTPPGGVARPAVNGRAVVYRLFDVGYAVQMDRVLDL